VLLGVAAVCWAIWLCRNNVVFQRSKPNSCLQVIFRSAFWIRSSSILSKEEDKTNLLIGSRRLETMSSEVFDSKKDCLLVGCLFSVCALLGCCRPSFISA
jgi:hypothetical protein